MCSERIKQVPIGYRSQFQRQLQLITWSHPAQLIRIMKQSYTWVKNCKLSSCLLIENTHKIEMMLKVSWYYVVNYKSTFYDYQWFFSDWNVDLSLRLLYDPWVISFQITQDKVDKQDKPACTCCRWWIRLYGLRRPDIICRAVLTIFPVFLVLVVSCSLLNELLNSIELFKV